MTTTITIDLDELVDSLTLGEVEQIEAITGAPIGHTLTKGAMSGTAVMAFVFVLKRRTDPSYTLDQARALRFEDVDLKKPERPAPPDPTPATG